MDKERIEGAIIEEPEQAPASSWVLVSQFFIVPVAIIALCVGIFILFGLITGESRNARDYIEEVKAGKGSRRWQAAFELSKYLNYRDNTKTDSRLTRDIIYALRNAKDDDHRVRQYLALALGKLHDSATFEPLMESLPELKGHQISEAMINAASAVTILQDASARPLLEELRRNDKDLKVRAAAIDALKKIP